MNNPTTSLFPVSKEPVLAATRSCIEEIRARRKEMFEAKVEKIMSRRFFRPRTRARAEEIAEQTRFPRWKIYAWGTLVQAEDLVETCGVTQGDIVFLSPEDAAFVAHYTKEVV